MSETAPPWYECDNAVGTEHAPWLEQEITAPGVTLLRGLLEAADPGRNLNPDKIVGTDRSDVAAR